jgi:hypothetical protein
VRLPLAYTSSARWYTHFISAFLRQTGSGKTYTVAGDTQRYDQRGIIPRSLHYLFSEIDLREDREVTVKCSYLEIYNEVMTTALSCSLPKSSFRREGPKPKLG